MSDRLVSLYSQLTNKHGGHDERAGRENKNNENQNT